MEKQPEFKDPSQMMAHLVEKMLQSQDKELKARNYRLYVMLGFALVVMFGYYFFLDALIRSTSDPMEDFSDKPYAAMVRINGEMSDGAPGGATNVIPALVRAFEDEKAVGVYIKINSPGGSPVQSQLILTRTQALKQEHKKKVVCMGEDMMTSAAYMTAMGCDVLYANPMSMVGSIGVKLENFGFTGAMQKLGVERRSVTAGENKTRLDPFKPVRKEDIEKLTGMVDHIHQQFIKIVTDARGNKLKRDPKELFTGDFWTGDEALELGLVDKLADNYGALKDEFEVQHVKDYTMMPSFFDRIAKSVSVQVQAAMNEGSEPRMQF